MIKVTANLVKDVFNFVERLLGAHAEGLYISEDVAYGDDELEDTPICTNFDDQSYIILSESENKEFSLATGITKLVIIPNYRPYVIKIPYSGLYRLTNLHYNIINEIDFINSTFTQISDVDGDICYEENEVCENFSEDTCSIIAKNIYVTNLNGIPIYIQEKIDHTVNLECHSNVEEKCAELGALPAEVKIAKYLYYKKYYNHFPLHYLYLLLKKYGIYRTMCLYEEIEDNINDLHCGNYGLSREGMPILIDIGGYDSEHWSENYQGEYV